MNDCLDLDIHIHSIASGHAFSTLHELVTTAINRSMKVIGISDHGPSMIGAPRESYFTMTRDINTFSKDIIVLFGCEANILDINGKIDLSVETVEQLNYVIAGLHKLTPYNYNDCLSNTKALIACMEKNRIFALVHPINGIFKIEIRPVVEAAKYHNIALEINDRELSHCSSDTYKNYIKLVEQCVKYGVPMIVGSDSHTLKTVGVFSQIEKIKAALDLSSVYTYNEHIQDFLNSIKVFGMRAEKNE